MIDLEKTTHHRVYKTEILGNAMVVTLQGDAPGFSMGAVQNEMATVIGLARQPDVQNLIIDLSGSNYYGSLILGEIVNLCQTVRDRGGRVALAGTSEDMKEVLRIMRLDALWERYPTRQMAIRAIASVSWQQRLKPYQTPAAILGCVLLLVALFFLIPRHDHTAEFLKEARGIWSEAVKKRSIGVSDVEWELFATRADQKFSDLTRRVSRMRGSDRLPAQHLLMAVRDHAPLALKARMDPKSEHTITASYLFSLVRSELNNQEPPPRPAEVKEVLIGSEKPTTPDGEPPASSPAKP